MDLCIACAHCDMVVYANKMFEFELKLINIDDDADCGGL